MKKNFDCFILIFVLMFSSLGLSAQKMMHTRHYRPHFVYATSIGFNAGVGKIKYEHHTLVNKVPLFNVNQLLAYQFNPYLTAGVELGLDIWKKTAFIPVMANLTLDFMDQKIIPTWYVNMGYAFKWYMPPKPEKMTGVIQGAKSGIHFNTGLGLKMKIKEQILLLVAADYKLQSTSIQYTVEELGQNYDYSQVITNRTEKALYHFVGVKVAIVYW